MINSIIESSPALPLVLPVTPLPIPEHDTDPALPISPVALSSLAFPQLFITAMESVESPRLAVYALESAPDAAFRDWLSYIKAASGTLHGIGRAKSYPLAMRYQLINALAESGIDMCRYLHASREGAEQAKDAWRTW